MKFNEKLIDLRKKQGLSQEELGYKLNVTRQTVSKWELGQTTPDMDKLTELSKIFNVSVDDLINEAEVTQPQNTVIEDQPIGEESPKNNKVVVIIVILLAIVLLWIVVKMVTGFSTASNQKEGFFDRVFGIVDKVVQQQQNIMQDINENEQNNFGEVENMMANFGDMFQNATSDLDVKKFNSSLEIYEGTGFGASIISALDEIIINNKKEGRIITVKYMETETQNVDEIKNIKRNIGNFDKYELFYEYDENGFINKAIIEKI